jgi:hypothetical protein
MARSIPVKKREYYEWIRFLVTWMVAKITAKGFDSQFVKDELEVNFNEYERCYLLCEDPTTNTSQNRAALRNAKKKLDKSASRAVEMMKSNILVTDTELDTAKIAHGTGGGKKPSPAPTTAPEFFIRHEKETLPGRLALAYKDFGKKLEGRPEHVAYMEYMYQIADEFITKIEDLKERGTDTASPIVFHRPSAERGKKLSIAGRWISNSGEPGDWGPVTGFIIP